MSSQGTLPFHSSWTSCLIFPKSPWFFCNLGLKNTPREILHCWPYDSQAFIAGTPKSFFLLQTAMWYQHSIISNCIHRVLPKETLHWASPTGATESKHFISHPAKKSKTWEMEGMIGHLISFLFLLVWLPGRYCIKRSGPHISFTSSWKQHLKIKFKNACVLKIFLCHSLAKLK